MACPTHERGDAGFATAGAMALCLGLVMIAAAMMTLALGELARSRALLRRTQSEYALMGAQRRASLDLMNNAAVVRLRWTTPSGDGMAEVLAEPEYGKASYAAVLAADDKLLARLDVTDLQPLRDRLQALIANPQSASIADLDSSPLWKACAPSLASRFGQAAELTLTVPVAPDNRGFSWRAGEVWRLAVTGEDGWVDDRIVRFTGDVSNPTATIARRFARSSKEDTRCDSAFGPRA